MKLRGEEEKAQPWWLCTDALRTVSVWQRGEFQRDKDRRCSCESYTRTLQKWWRGRDGGAGEKPLASEKMEQMSG
jgi:hypothetical protein